MEAILRSDIGIRSGQLIEWVTGLLAGAFEPIRITDHLLLPEVGQPGSGDQQEL